MRVGDDPFDAAAAQRLTQHAFPARHERLGARDDDLLLAHLDGKNVVALRERVRHHLGRLVDVHLQRVDAVVRLAGHLRQPVRERFEVELLAGMPRIVEFAIGDQLERVHVQLPRQPRRNQEVFGVALRDDVRADQIFEHTAHVQQPLRRDAILQRGFDCRHGHSMPRALIAPQLTARLGRFQPDHVPADVQ